MRLRMPLPLLLLAAASANARAQSRETDHDRAVTHFEAGRRMVEQGRCNEAVPRFVESIRAEASVGARFNLAACFAQAGKPMDAWNQYKSAEQLAIRKNDAPRAELAHAAAAELEPKVLKVRLLLPEAIQYTVKIDGELVSETDYELMGTGYAVAPGSAHTIEVSAKNRSLWVRSGVLGPPGAELPVILVTMLPANAPAHDEVPAKKNAGSGQRTIGLAVGGVGIAGVAFGAVFGMMALGDKASIKNACGGSYPAGCSASVGSQDQANSSLESKALLSTIGFAAGGALVVGGAALYLTAPRAKATSSARLQVMPVASPTVAGGMIGGVF